MKYLSSKPWRMLLLALMPLLISLACITVLSDDSSVDSQPLEAVTAQADVDFGPGPFDLLDTTAGLSNLPSYRATLTLAFEGIRNGQPSQWSKTYLMLATNEPVMRQLTLENTGDISDLDAAFLAEAEGAAYEKLGGSACKANVIEAGNSLSERLEPAGFLPGVIGAEEAGAETINGAASNHYNFDERAFGQPGLVKSTGEIWVASEGGYIVRYLLTTNGNADYFGEGIEGTLTWDYELTDVDQPVTIALPEDCPAGMVNAPLLPDASDVLNVPSLLAYDTSSSLADAAAFYQEQLPGLGWTLLGEPAIGETTALMEFTQEDQIMTIIIAIVNNRTTINMVLDNVQK
jgi:hypothetical protein